MRRSALCLGIITATCALLATPAPAAGAPVDRAELLIVEVLTGASSASDEYVQIEAQGTGGAALSGLEVIYRSASGITTRRLASLATMPQLSFGERLMLANAVGSFAGQAQLTWSDGIASSGGAILIRRLTAPYEIVDAVAWGSAVAAAGGEGLPVSAPASGVRIQRRRDATGALVDTGDNSVDFLLVSPLQPTPTPSPTSTPVVTAAPTPTPTASPTPSAPPSATPAPSVAPTPTLSPSPTPSPTPSPPSTPTPTPSPTPSIPPLSVGAARDAVIGSRLRLTGTLVARQGELAEAGLLALQDPVTGAGIFVLAPTVGSVPVGAAVRGSQVVVEGVLTLRRQTLTIIASGAPVVTGSGTILPPLALQRPASGAWGWEAWEGRRVRVGGTIAGSPQSLAEGAVSLRLRLQSGDELALGMAAEVAASLPVALRESGSVVVAEGLLHQRGSVSGGGYRLWLDPVAGLVPRIVPPPSGGDGGSTVTDPGGRSEPSTPSLTLPLGVPTIAIPEGATRGWMAEIVTSLRVTAGRLELQRAGGVQLVVLPSCVAPVDHEGEAPYPTSR